MGSFRVKERQEDGFLLFFYFVCCWGFELGPHLTASQTLDHQLHQTTLVPLYLQEYLLWWRNIRMLVVLSLHILKYQHVSPGK